MTSSMTCRKRKKKIHSCGGIKHLNKEGQAILKNKFSRRVIATVQQIPRGKTLSYQAVAKQAGNPKAVRAVGTILRRYYYACLESGAKTIPCHRVIRNDGKLGGYVLGKEVKKEKLKEEKANLKQ